MNVPEIIRLLLLFCLLTYGAAAGGATIGTPVPVLTPPVEAVATSAEISDFNHLDRVKGELAWQTLPSAGGLTGSVLPHLWYRSRLQVQDLFPRTSAPRDLMVIANPLLDHFIIRFTDGRGQTLAVYQGGDLLPFKQREYDHRNFLFSLKDLQHTLQAAGAHPEDPLVIHAMVRSFATLDLKMSFANNKSFWEAESREVILYSIFFGVLMLMLGYVVIFGAHYKSNFIFHYGLYILFCGLVFFSLKGFAYQWIWPESPFLQARATIILWALAVAGAVLFVVYSGRQIYELYLPAAVKWNARGLIVFSCLSLVLPWDLGYYVILYWIGVATVVNLAMFLWYLFRNPHIDPFYFIAWGTFGFGVGSTVLVHMGILPDRFVLREGALIGAVFHFVFMTKAVRSSIHISLQQKDNIRTALAGVVPDRIVRQLMDNPNQLDQEPRAVNLSVMFIDIVSYSKACEYMTPGEAFHELRAYLDIIARQITESGGTVDRSLGDGVLCYFGYSLKGYQTDDHARQAIDAAVNIQRAVMDRWLNNRDTTRIFPLRIGIHSDDVVIGNLGNLERLDYTIIGSSVNTAKRYESSCNPFKILTSTSTMEQAGTGAVPANSLNEMRIKIKHIDGLVSAREINPFVDRQEDVLAAERSFWTSIHKSITEERLPLNGRDLVICTDEADFHVLDLSDTGLSAVADKYIGRGVILMAHLRTAPDEKFSLEVRWSRPSGQGFKHGFSIIGSQEQRQRVCQILGSAVRRQGA